MKPRIQALRLCHWRLNRLTIVIWYNEMKTEVNFAKTHVEIIVIYTYINVCLSHDN
jgi:hypothetical protein